MVIFFIPIVSALGLWN